MTLLENAKELDEFNQYIGDEDVEFALRTIVKLIAKPDVPHQVLGPTIVQLQAISAKVKTMAAVETHLYKNDRARKNLLYSFSESLDNLVSALKYLAK
jgi:ferritin